MKFINESEKIFKRIQLNNGQQISVLIQVTDDENEFDKNLFNISLYLDSEDGRNRIGCLHASNYQSLSKEQLTIDDNIIGDKLRGCGLGNFQLQYFIDYIKRKRPNIKKFIWNPHRKRLKRNYVFRTML